MLTPPTDLHPTLIRAELLRYWPLGTDDLGLAYLPLGFGSHHWAATAPDGRRWFVTADDHRVPVRGTHLATGPDDLDVTLRTVAALRDRFGLTFAHGPRLARDGRAARPAGDTGWTLSVYPFLDGTPLGDHGRIPADDRAAVLDMLARLHAVPVADLDRPPRLFDFTIGHRPELEAALADTGSPWGTGPYADRVREMLAGSADGIRQALIEHDRRVERVMADRSGWVLTHGEPHGGNILRGPDGALHLIDWDSLALGPPERDLAGIPGEITAADRTAYVEAGGTDAISAATIQTRHRWWDLNDLAEYVAWFRAPHEDTPEMRVAWEAIVGLLPALMRSVDD